MRNKSGKLLKELQFKEPGKPELYTSKPGKQVKVDRHATEPGKYIVWATSRRYACVAGEELHTIVTFEV
jgi:hypothetical protein